MKERREGKQNILTATHYSVRLSQQFQRGSKGSKSKGSEIGRLLQIKLYLTIMVIIIYDIKVYL